ncbi:ParB/RepB/Spo0J family partition protein [Ktedonosporobacter rubrisoli]|uniref:ParB/RepB/Spo0J family partition protein n=1 Tax=Ktedonosporobacter rubrisoli TaxID=2509675 RepID=A0A4P6JY49_KTERU|nr:ParB/RepB/Spo0J family partition protein [Ktedonosporobacter rubrisoli]QBD80604.1 ParB/RepB/Spo0J family partition protein [Ktedonosporobacter rubrisoli]
MAKQKFGLGRGLDALISGASEVLSAQQPMRNGAETLPQVPLENIIPNPRQPRRAFREDDPRLLELSDSIKEHGLLQPIVVMRLDQQEKADAAQKQALSWLAEDVSAATDSAEPSSASVVQYQIIAGERRWRAARMAGLTNVPVVIKDVTPQQMLELALIENIQRADLNPIEEALAYQALIQDFGLTQEMVARQVGKDRSTIANSLRLLQLPPAYVRPLCSNLRPLPKAMPALCSSSPMRRISSRLCSRLSPKGSAYARLKSWPARLRRQRMARLRRWRKLLLPILPN